MSAEKAVPTGGPGGIRLKRLVRSALDSADFEDALRGLEAPPERLIGPLISLLCATDDLVRWRAVRAIGITVAGMAEDSPEAARDIFRRLMWSLNDESGGIGWGAPEAMGEIMAESAVLSCEYYRILLSYIDESGNPLENDLLERGVLWGIGRLARSRPELILQAEPSVRRQLHSADPVKRGLAVWALGFLRLSGEVAAALVPLLNDEAELAVYQDGGFRRCTVGELARELTAKLGA
ncbi:MAG: hypothetical protein LLG06_11050 [Desulfobacteraceae bacterium]|nr:hypothetical protein [Desulfobacteraceae bacterium]